MNQELFQYACALRSHQLTDAEITVKLTALGLTVDEAAQVIASLDQAGWTSESNSKPTIVGWLSVLIAVGGTLVSAIYMATSTAIDTGIVKVIFVLPFVVIGFVLHVIFSKLLEAIGIKTTKPDPLEIPEAKPMRLAITKARKANVSPL